MHKTITHLAVAVAGACVLSTLGGTAASASGAASLPLAKAGSDGTSRAATGPGTVLWSEQDGNSITANSAHAVAVSPDGGTVFVTGSSCDTCNGAPSSAGTRDPDSPSYVTIAYNTATGAQDWLANGPAGGASSVAVSPDGGTVFVTGSSGTVAYNAATGAQDWLAAGPTGGASSLVVSPGGSKVFVTGSSTGTSSGYDYATVAYNAATGAQLWTESYNGPANGDDKAVSVKVSPGGGRVFVTGTSAGTGSTSDYATVAYNAFTGAQLWVKRYGGRGGGSAASLAVSSGGGRVFVTGTSAGDYATVGYSAKTGRQLWVKRYGGTAGGSAASVAVSPGGGRVFVTGSSAGDYATVAYTADTGTKLWVKRYIGPGYNGQDNSSAASVGVSPAGGTVYVTGTTTSDVDFPNFATVAYDAATGAVDWTSVTVTSDDQYEWASALAVSPTDGTVFVTGAWSFSSPSWLGTSYLTAAYSG